MMKLTHLCCDRCRTIAMIGVWKWHLCLVGAIVQALLVIRISGRECILFAFVWWVYPIVNEIQFEYRHQLTRFDRILLKQRLFNGLLHCIVGR